MHQGNQDIIVQNLSKSFQAVKAVDDKSFEDSPGEPFASSSSASANTSSKNAGYHNHQE